MPRRRRGRRPAGADGTLAGRPSLVRGRSLRGFDLVLIPGWLVGLAAGAVVLGWLYERSGSSSLA